MATCSVVLPGKSHGQRSLVGYSSWDCKESNMTELLMLSHIVFTTYQLLLWLSTLISLLSIFKMVTQIVLRYRVTYCRNITFSYSRSLNGRVYFPLTQQSKGRGTYSAGKWSCNSHTQLHLVGSRWLLSFSWSPVSRKLKRKKGDCDSCFIGISGN